MINETIFRNVLTDILKEIQNCPEDSIQDITNEMFERWEIDDKFTCNHKLEIEKI